ncbi:DNA-binding transcriptional regulator [Rubellicoccus peritrichatus]|uniref:DNA-binding transcriptional regulator n=1 Tax=Rubellicoccus peritrichatus TaxID=3080537 RepID=A0AAQ3QWM6_9BACT|nr:DNA-binding transcriptional regulator [Puniceicoccus sp. CR14]WOO42047.1 DNA-binding transcriptional regulator [Puniceicoccus sp. CR14]
MEKEDEELLVTDMSSKRDVLVMIESSRESGRQLIAGLADYARHFGPWNFHWHPLGLGSLEAPLEGIKLDGMMVRDMAGVPASIKAGVPAIDFTFSKAISKGAGWANTDDQAVSKTIAEHFLQRGFRNFAYCGYKDRPWSIDRGKHFTAWLQKADYAVNNFWIPSDSWGGTDNLEIIQWLESLPHRTALMATNDDLGRRLVGLCQEADLRVPDDCAIIGVDNDPLICGMSNPPLSSVKIDQYQAGYDAAAMLDKMMKGKPPKNLVVTAQVGELIVRQSSDIIAVEDAAVSKALRFIQQNAHRAVKVDEVARASGLFRRSLERRFREHLSRSISDYCREARAERLEKILRETRLNLEEIAEQSGFSEASHLTRFFITVRGESPSQYRKRVSLR